MDAEYIRSRITELRMKKGIAEHRMSIELGHSRSYMQGISSGRALPSMAEFLAICDYLDVTPKEFFEDENVNPSLYRDTLEKIIHLTEEDLEIINIIADRMLR